MQQVVKEKLSITQVELLLKGNSPFVFSDRDLSHLDLQGKEMNGAKFFGSVLFRTNFSNSQIANAYFGSSKLGETLFINSDLTDIDLNNSKVPGTNFSNATMVRAILKYCSSIHYNPYAHGPIFTNTNLTRSDFYYAKIPKANFSDSNLTDTKLKYAILTDANFTNANLTNADLTNADLTKANFNGAILTNANLAGANLKGAILTNANLAGANLSSASLEKSNCENADFTNANIVNVSFSGAKLTGAKFYGVIRESFSSDFDQIRSASRSFLNLLENPDLSTDQKKQMIEIDDANPNKTKLSQYLKERGEIIINNSRAGSDEKMEFESFLKEVIELEKKLMPKVVQQPLIKQEPGEPLIVVKSEPQEPSRVVNKRQREEESSAANVGMGSRQDIPQGAPMTRYVDEEILGAAKILSSINKDRT